MKASLVKIFGLNLLVGLLLLTSCASERVVKRSSRNQPNWVYGMQSGYFISTGAGQSYEEAQTNAITNLKDMIIKSIAVQVISKSEAQTNERINEEFSDYLSTYENNIEVYSEYFKPLKGVSASKVEDFYWEMVKTQDGKEVRYHIKYPFSNVQLQSLITDFEALNAEMELKLQAIEENGDNYTSLEMIIDDIRKVENLMSMLPRSKRQRALRKIEELEAVLDDISFIVLDDSSGYLSYELRLYGEPMTVSKAPDIYASCPISILEFKSFKYKNLVRYDRSKCDAFKDEKLTVAYKYAEKTIKRNFVIPEPVNTAEIFEIKNLSIENLGLSVGICRFEIESVGDKDLLIEKIALTFYRTDQQSRRTRVEMTPYVKLEPEKAKAVEQRFRFPFKKGINVLKATFDSNNFRADLELIDADGQSYIVRAVPLEFSF